MSISDETKPIMFSMKKYINVIELAKIDLLIMVMMTTLIYDVVHP